MLAGINSTIRIIFSSSTESFLPHQNWQYVQERVQEYVDSTNSFVNSIQQGEKSYYHPLKDYISIEAELVQKDRELALLVGLHEAVHAYQRDRIWLGSKILSSVFDTFKLVLRTTTALSVNLLLLCIVFPTILPYVTGILVVSYVSLLSEEYEASAKALDYANNRLSIKSERAKKYLHAAFYTYINKAVYIAGVNLIAFIGIYESYSFSEHLLPIGICWVLYILIQLSLQRKLKAIEQ